MGITGVPGAGKSTSIDAFGMHILKERGGRLAVLAVDPSSERSKGSILGDKTRMERLSLHPDAFIRPSASAGSLGGVARKTRETIILCEAAGYDTIFVETVGVGQSETAVCSMVDFFLLIQIAGAGDELQGIKRGIMEMADGIVINKADGDNIAEARRAATHYRNALQLFPMPESGRRPEVLTYSGFYDIGIKEVWASLTGTPQPYSARRGDTWDLRHGFLLSLADCFPPHTPWRKQLLAFSCDRICGWEAQGIARYHENWQQKLHQAFHPHNFYLTEEGLCFFFPFASIAPPIEGIPTFCMPYNDQSGPFIPSV